MRVPCWRCPSCRIGLAEAATVAWKLAGARRDPRSNAMRMLALAYALAAVAP